jgi:pyruvate dehydrogenase E1 component alpha subunit
VEVYRTAGEAVQRARDGLGPSFIEYQTYRLRGHAGVPSQDAQGYRISEEVEKWEARCPIKLMQQKLLEIGVITPAEIEALKKRIEAELDDAFSVARKDRLPPKEHLHHYLFCEPE